MHEVWSGTRTGTPWHSDWDAMAPDAMADSEAPEQLRLSRRHSLGSTRQPEHVSSQSQTTARIASSSTEPALSLQRTTVTPPTSAQPQARRALPRTSLPSLPVAAKAWPPCQEARGLVSLRVHPNREIGSVEAMCRLKNKMLTIYTKSLPGSAFDTCSCSIPVHRLVLTLHPGQFTTLNLSCDTTDTGIFCSCKDQTARNKWVYVLRRVEGVLVCVADSAAKLREY